MSNKDYVLVIVTSDTCGHCTVFKNNERDPLLNRLENDPRLEVVEVDIINGDASVINNFHPMLRIYVGWFPEFILFKGNSWREHDQPLIGKIMGGFMEKKNVNGIETMKAEYDPNSGAKPTVENILDWINQTLPFGGAPPTSTGRYSSDEMSRVQGSSGTRTSSPRDQIRLPTYGSARRIEKNSRPGGVRMQFRHSQIDSTIN